MTKTNQCDKNKYDKDKSTSKNQINDKSNQWQKQINDKSTSKSMFASQLNALITQ